MNKAVNPRQDGNEYVLIRQKIHIKQTETLH